MDPLTPVSGTKKSRWGLEVPESTEAVAGGRPSPANPYGILPPRKSGKLQPFKGIEVVAGYPAEDQVSKDRE